MQCTVGRRGCGGLGQGRSGWGHPEAWSEQRVPRDSHGQPALLISTKPLTGLVSSVSESPPCTPAWSAASFWLFSGCPPHTPSLQEGRCNPVGGRTSPGPLCPSPALSPAPLPWAYGAQNLG